MPKQAWVGLLLGVLITVFPVGLAVMLTDTTPAPTAPVLPKVVKEAPPVKNEPPTLHEIPAVNPFRDDALPELKDLLAEDARNPGAIKYSLVQRPNEAVEIALQDLLDYGARNASNQPFVRYLWFPTPTELTEAELAYTLNTAVSHAQFPYKAVRISPNLFRINLAELAPEKDDFERLVQIWENDLPRHNFWFNTIRDGKFTITEKQKVKKTKTIEEEVKVPVKDRWGNHARDQWGKPQFTIKKVPKTVEVEVEEDVTKEIESEVSEFAIHTGLDKMLLLATLTQSSVPIYHGPDFMVRALTTIDGGLYYKFVNMPKGKNGKTDLQAFVELLGGNPDEQARKKDASFVAVPISGVTHKPRLVEYFYGNKETRPGVGPQLITITHDLRNEDVQGGKLTRKTILRNLLNFKGTAYEGIGSRPNGTFLFGLWNDKQELIDSAPDFVAKDNVFPGILQSAISCIGCHGPNDGRQPTINGIKNITRGYLDIFDDESSDKDPRETINLLVSMYKGDLTYPLMVTRNTHAQAVYQMTGGKSVPGIAASLRALHNEHLFAPITPKKVMLDLGYFVETEEDAVRLFGRILPPLPPNRYGISPEDPFLGQIREWDPKEPTYTLPQEWNQILSDALLRVITTEAKVRIEHPELKMHGPVNLQPVTKDLHKVKDAK